MRTFAPLKIPLFMKNIRTISILLIVLLGNTFFGYSQTKMKHNPIITSEFIFETASFKQCHASTIVELKDGSLLSAWFGGSYEGATDVSIWISFYHKGKWSVPKIAAEGNENRVGREACWNPVLFRNANGKLFLFYKIGKNPQSWWGMYKVSTDEGKTWSEEQELPEGFLGPIKNKPIALKDGTLLCPSSIEKGDKWTVHIERTSDEGKTWNKTQVEASGDIKVIQPSILMHSADKLQLLCRSNQNHIVQSWSYDGGKSWSKLMWTNMPNPNSGIDAVSLSNGMFMLVYNPMEAGEEWVVGRNKLNVAISKDGIDWDVIAVLENEKEGEFSYPAIIETKDKKVHITYTYNRKLIKHIVLELL